MNSKILKIVNNFFDKFFWRQHPETALRYLPVVHEIKKAKLSESRILEIGSGSLGITPYFKRKIDGVDVNFTGSPSKFLNKIKGSADDLPFHKNSYDVVISVDVIEHLPTNIRQKALGEMLRVAKKLAILVVPTGNSSHKQDQELDHHYQKIFKNRNQFLKEHVTYGLPSADEILVTVDKSLSQLGKKAKITSQPLLNLFIRNILMRTWITKSNFCYYLYLKGFLFLLPILKLCNFGVCYRRMFVIEFLTPA